MCYLPDEIESTPEAILLATFEHPQVGQAIFADDHQFATVLNYSRTGTEKRELKENRRHGRQILTSAGLTPIALGSERIVLEDKESGEVVKYAHLSTDPEGDREVEEFDHEYCTRHFGDLVVPTVIGVELLKDQEVLTSRQPRIEGLRNSQTVLDEGVANWVEAIIKKARYLGDGLGIGLDATSIMVGPDNTPLIIDTSLIAPFRLFGDSETELPRRERSWRSLGMTANDDLVSVC